MERIDLTTRRDFLRTAAATGAALTVAPLFGCATAPSAGAPSATPAPAPQPTSLPAYRELRLAYIGTGGIGGQHLEETAKYGVRCPCFCDVDTTRFEQAAKLFPDARRYQDYREMFDREHRNIDAVMIGTPDHHHFPATLIAMQLGKHVYTQKPLTHTVWEARQLAAAAERYKVATQMGNQGHAGEGWRLVYEFLHSGAIGDVVETHTWTDRPIWPQGIKRPEGEDPIPPTLNWDAWLGPAPVRPYKAEVYHAFAWRGWWDFGCGALGDMACHMMDGLFWALDPGHPISVEPLAATDVNNETFPKASVLKWEFARRGRRPGFTAYWYDGGLIPRNPPELEPDRRLSATGNLFIGTKGALFVQGDYGNSPRLIPDARMRAFGRPKPLLERSPGHYEEWLMACVGEKPVDYPKSNFRYAAPMTETILLGNVALRCGRRIEWDGPALRVTNFLPANQYLTKEYRAGWRFGVS